MTLTVAPGAVTGTTRAPRSKSVTHRALFLALLAGEGEVRHPLLGEDTLATVDAIEAFGASVSRSPDAVSIDGVRLAPAEIDVRNSGTTLRIATAVAALCDGPSRLTGDASIRGRPMAPLVEALGALGAEASCLGEAGTPPVEVAGPAPGGAATVDASVSSQFVTALSLIGPRLPDGLALRYGADAVSRPYIELTHRLLAEAGVTLEADDGAVRIPPQAIAPVSIAVPGDYSAAAFPLVAGAMTGGRVRVEGLPPDTAQGDAGIVELLREFGVGTARAGSTVRVEGRATTPAAIDLGPTPDLFPPLAALAASVEGTTELTGASHLRAKESDRIAAMVEGLGRLGVEAEALADGARIRGGTPTGGSVSSHDDHRIQMALALVGLVASGPVTVTGRPDVHRVSYPGFPAVLAGLGADVRLAGEAVQPVEGAGG